MISFRPLKEMMKSKDISTYYLRYKCNDDNLDYKTIARLIGDDSVSTNTIDKLCRIFDCGVCDIMEFVPNRKPGEGEGNGG